jgi:hypothetical protein
VSEERYDANALFAAAQAQIESLQNSVIEAQEDARRARKDRRLTKIQVRILGAVCALLIAVTCVVGAVLGQQTTLSNNLRQQVIQSCQSGNAQRAQEIKVWDSFIDLILQGNKNPQAEQEGEQFKDFVAQVYAPRNCQQVYSTAQSMDDTGMPGN